MQIIFIPFNFYRVQVKITDDAVLFIGFNDGYGMLFITYQVRQGKIRI